MHMYASFSGIHVSGIRPGGGVPYTYICSYIQVFFGLYMYIVTTITTIV